MIRQWSFPMRIAESLARLRPRDSLHALAKNLTPYEAESHLRRNIDSHCHFESRPVMPDDVGRIRLWIEVRYDDRGLLRLKGGTADINGSDRSS
jgi:hypothetical protein